MTQISFWGGIGRIGGNKILVIPENKSKKSILLDFGKDFNIPYLDTFLNPRKFNLIEDYITLGMIPEPKPDTPFHGLYRQDLYYFKPKLVTDDPEKQRGLIKSEDENFLDIRIPISNLRVIGTKYYDSPQYGENYQIIFKATYEEIEEKIILSHKKFDLFSSTFKADQEDLLARIKEGGYEGTAKLNEFLNDIAHPSDDKEIYVKCNRFKDNWYIFDIFYDVPSPDLQKIEEYKRNYRIWQERFGYDPRGAPQISHVLVSHAHSDHATELYLLDPRVAIVCSMITREILEHFEFIQSKSFKEIINYAQHFKLVPTKRDPAKLRRSYKRDGKIFERKIIGLNSENEIVLREDPTKSTLKGEKTFKIRYLDVDHSIPGAGAYLIEDLESKKRIVYTGDLRLHGPPNLKEKTVTFFQEARDFHPDVLICEGTNVTEASREKGEVANEDVLVQEITKIIRNAKGLVLFASSLRDLTRFNSFLRAARECGRKLAVLPQIYQLIERLNHAIKEKRVVGDYSNIPELDKAIIPYLSRRGWGNYEKEDYGYNPASKSYFNEKTKKDSDAEDKVSPLTIDDIAQNQASHVVYLPFWALFSLIDLKPLPNSIFIHSKSTPFEPEMELEHEKLLAWLQLFGIGDDHFYQVHCSGHGRMKDIEYIIKEISPKVVYPIHTENPELFLSMDLGGTEVIIPEKKKFYAV